MEGTWEHLEWGRVVVFPKHSPKEHVSLLVEPSTKPQSPWPGHGLSSVAEEWQDRQACSSAPTMQSRAVSSRPRNSQVLQKPRYWEGPGLIRGCHIAPKNQMRQVVTNLGTRPDHPLHSVDQWESRREHFDSESPSLCFFHHEVSMVPLNWVPYWKPA